MVKYTTGGHIDHPIDLIDPCWPPVYFTKTCCISYHTGDLPTCIFLATQVIYPSVVYFTTLVIYTPVAYFTTPVIYSPVVHLTTLVIYLPVVCFYHTGDLPTCCMFLSHLWSTHLLHILPRLWPTHLLYILTSPPPPVRLPTCGWITSVVKYTAGGKIMNVVK